MPDAQTSSVSNHNPSPCFVAVGRVGIGSEGFVTNLQLDLLPLA